MASRSPVLVLLFAGLIVGAALLIFLIGGSDSREVDSTVRDTVVVERTQDTEIEADLEGIRAAETARRMDDVSNALTRAQGISGGLSAQPKKVMPKGPYAGRILDNLGRPLGAVEVSLQPWTDASELLSRRFQPGRSKAKFLEVTTDSEGRFSVQPKKPLGRVLGVTATARGYVKAPMKHVFAEADGNELGDIILEPAVIVEGWVRDQNGRPIANARVRRIEHDGDAMVAMLDQIGFSSLLNLVTTDEDGRFELPHEKEGKIVLLAEHDDILAARYVGPAKRGGEVLQDIVIHAQRAGQIHGIVMGYPRGRVRGIVSAAALDPSEDENDDKGLSAIMSARLSPAGKHRATVGPNGSFTIGGLTPGGRYELRVTERRRFVETVMLSDTVEAQADGESVSLRFDAGAEATLRVIDRETKKPVEVMKISARWPDGEMSRLQFTPDGERVPKRFPKGQVKLHELRPDGGRDKLTVTVDAPGYMRAKTKVVDVGASGVADAGTIELVASPRLRFRVIDRATREPIRRAKVMLSNSGPPDSEEALRNALFSGETRRSAYAKTNRKGLCELSALGEETLVLSVRVRDYAKYVQRGFDQTAAGEEILIELSKGGTIEVTVVDPNGDPLTEGVRVRCKTTIDGVESTMRKSGDGAGQAVFSALRAGTYEIMAVRGTGPDYGRRGRDKKGEGEWMTVAVAGGSFVEVDYELPMVGSLTGMVTIRRGPAVGARVSVVKEEDADKTERFILVQDQYSGFGQRSTGDTTGPDGAFELTDIEPGAYALLVRHSDVAMVTRVKVEIGLGVSTVDVELLLTAIEGNVVDHDGEPIAGASVSVRRFDPDGDTEVRLVRSFLGVSQSTARTDIDGHYVVTGVRADTQLQIAVQADSFTDATSSVVTVAERETREIAPIKLARAGAVLVTLTGDDVAGELYFATAKREEGETAQDKIELIRGGRARITGLSAGRWIIKAQRTGRGSDGGRAETESVTVEVKPGKTAEVELER